MNKDLSFRQMKALELNQAMLGLVSPNFRTVTMLAQKGSVLVTVVLEQESDEDREAIEDCLCDFEALQAENLDIRFDVLVDSGPLNVKDPEGEAWVIYYRREY